MNQRNLLYAAILMAGVVIGAVASATLSSADRDAAPGADTAPAQPVARYQRPADGDNRAIVDMLDSLSLALTQESEYRLVLEEQIDELSNRVDELQALVGDAGDMRNTRSALESEKLRAMAQRRNRPRGPLSVEKLVAVGMSERDASALKLKLDDIAMQRLYLRDQAMREGWMGDQRYREETQRLAAAQNNIRADFGDDNYDRYLYAAGRPNRVQIQSVLENSPAFEAGLRAGDQLVRYNDSRTYAPNELRRATQQGNAGEMIPLQVMRNGTLIDVYVPRGPLGVQMTGVSEKP